MTFKEFTGKNVEEAIRAAMKEFGAELSDLDIEILAQGSRGILGVGGEEARILAAPKSAVAAAETVRAPAPPEVEGAEAGDETAGTGAAPAPAPESAEAGGTGEIGETGEAAGEEAEAAAAPSRARGGRGRTRGGNGRERDRGRRERPERSERGPRRARAPRAERPEGERREPAPFVPAKPMEELSDVERATVDDARTVLEELLRLMDLEATVEVAMGTEAAKLNVKGPELGVLIGRRGEKLASLQHLVNLIVAKREGQHNRIAIDVENYRGRREQQLRDVAERAAKRVTQTGKIIQLEAMPAIERRIVHLSLVDNRKVRTQSVGVEPNRRVVILPASQADRS